MKCTHFIQVFEYETLRYNDSGKFRRHHFDAMVKFNELHQNKYFTVVHRGIRFCNYVGVIQAGSLVIEILPKADKNSSSDKNLWQSVLLNMLTVCKRIQVESISEAKLKKRYNSILDAYWDLYLNEIERLIKRGLIKRYRKKQSNQYALKGKLVFSKNIQYNAAHGERFYCEHQVYDKTHLLHSILYKGLLIVDTLIDSHRKDRVKRLLHEFDKFEKMNIKKEHFDKIIINRKNSDYKRALDIAKIIILNYSPSLSSGKDNLLTLLFDMNKLWEEYIYRILHKYKEDSDEVFFQNSKQFWKNKSIRPDIVVKTNNKTFVIDTKWKIIEDNNPSDNDLKQMFAYSLHWEAQKTLLLYPKTNQEDSEFGIFHYNNLKNMCKIGFVSITDEGGFKSNSSIANEVFNKLALHT